MILHQDFKPEGALQRALFSLDRVSWILGGVFMWLSNICLLGMLGLTSLTIIARPLGWSAYWIWPWTMVLFVWLSFFGFFAVYVRLKDVRIDFVANHLGPYGYPATRVLADMCALAICGVLLVQMPTVLQTSRGIVDGVVFPGGGELMRQALSIPLFLSATLILLAALLDLAKMFAGMPENVTLHHVED